MHLDRRLFIEICDVKLKLIRTEYSFSQEKMAQSLGISKKTLVEIEKGRSSLGWTGCVALTSIFYESEIVASSFGGNPIDIIRSLAFEGSEPPRHQVTSNKIWWQIIMKNEKYQIQQNIISQHYRLITTDGNRIASSFDIDDLTEQFSGNENNNKGVKK